MKVRLQKFLADAGVASRRASEKLIADGQVEVNGQVVRRQGVQIDSKSDVVTVDGNTVRRRKKVYVAVYKPTGYVTTKRDEGGKKDVMALLPARWQHLHPVGRLDKDTEGLLLLTNDGDFSMQVTHPRFGVTKRYVVQVNGRVTGKVTAQICRGIVDKGENLKALKAKIISANNTHSTVEIELAEGRNREVRRLFAACDHKVVQLCRISVGCVNLGELPSGKWRTLTDSEIKSLLARS
ncbi:MAG: pseudouridine synthase [Limisphaerales bacterium]